MRSEPFFTTVTSAASPIGSNKTWLLSNLRTSAYDFPIYNASSRSLKKQLIQAVTGGELRKEESGRVVVSVLKELTFTLRDSGALVCSVTMVRGKSTLLRLLNNVYFPSSGQALIEGTTGSLIDISLGTDPEATGRENIYLRGALLGMTSRNKPLRE